MSRRLRSTVYLTGEDGTTTCLLAGSVPAAAQAARITNPRAWGGTADVPLHALEHVLSAEPAPPVVRQPPRRGPGSSRAAWAGYAAARGVDVPEDADRDAIMAAVDAAAEG